MPLLPWPEIESFHNIRKFVRVDPAEWFRAKEQLHGSSIVTYKAKVKLHGTNAAIQLTPEHTLVCQSRESIITPEKDNAGFARWVKEHEKEWLRAHWNDGLIIYGEWCGPGIQKNVAVSEAPKKFFAVFAIRSMKPGHTAVMVEPDQIETILADFKIPGLYVLPWYFRPCHYGCDTNVTQKLDINWRQTDEDLTKNTAVINDWVKEVEERDPWVEMVFGIKGTGEGLVFYPVSEPHQDWESFQNLCFKAKGEKHKNIATAKPAQVNPETAANANAFVELVLTPARLEQGAQKVGGFDLKLTGQFVNWISSDVQKECQDEIAASKLDWKQVQKPLLDRARSWYIGEAKVR